MQEACGYHRLVTGEASWSMWERQTHRKAFWGSGKVELLSDETLACTPGEAGKTGTGG